MRHTRQLLVMIYALCLAVVMQAQTPVSVTPVTSTEGYDFYATFLPNGNSKREAPDLMLKFLVSAREVPGHPEISNATIGVQCGLGYNKEYDIPVAFHFPLGHVDDNLPLVNGANATLTVRESGTTLKFKK